MTKTNKKAANSRIVDTAIVLDAAQKHKKATASALKRASTIKERCEDADTKAQAEVDRAFEDHRQSLR